MNRPFASIGFVILAALVLTGCGGATSSEVVIVHTQEVTVVVTVVVAATPQPTEAVADQPVTSSIDLVPDWIASGNAREFVGEQVQIRVDRAWCSYQPGINGEPTFCNDARYPGHSFTFLVWGQDWSDLDGQCVLVDGTVEMYDGLPQIEVEDRAQVRPCDP
jgi:hypothetical protein